MIGITGSVGKTGTRLATAAVLGVKWRVGAVHKNLNNEIGLPLAILNEPDSGYNSLRCWLGIFSRAIRQLLVKSHNYPEVLVLEYGVDHPGDMDYLLSIAQPSVAVITAVAATHLEFFGSVAEVAKEKGKLISTLPAGGLAILNFDFALVAGMAAKTKARVIGYGESAPAEVRFSGSAVSLSEDKTMQGMSFRLALGGSTVPVLIKHAVGKPVVSMAAAAAAVGLGLGLSVLEIKQGLENFQPPLGRLRLVNGWHGSCLIDDTYNSSPQAVLAALEILRDLPLAGDAKRWAVLGSMLELGQASERLHMEIGKQIAVFKPDYLVTVGDEAKRILTGARQAGFPEPASWQAESHEQVIEIIRPKLKPGDAVLIKGSQGIRCEKIVKGLMLEPAKANELLVRQTPPWIER